MEVYTSVIHEINCISVELRNAIIHLDLNKTKQNLPLYVFSKPQKSYFSGNMIASYNILLIHSRLGANNYLQRPCFFTTKQIIIQL